MAGPRSSMATRGSGRIHTSSGVVSVRTTSSGSPERDASDGGLFGEAGHPVVELDAEAVQRPGDHVVLADGEHGVHLLAHVVALVEGGPGGVGDDAVALQLV